jgi:hypothetical protein
MAAIVALLCIVTLAFGERIGVNEGQGWDGLGYTEWATDYPLALAYGTDAYHAQRVLPSAVVYYGTEALGLAHKSPLFAFALLDSVAIVLAAFVWGRLGRAWTRAAAWAGFVGVFGSFAVARHTLYYPSLTDPSAFLLGMLAAWAFIERRPVMQWLVALASAVTWPALVPVSLGLLVLRRPVEPPPEVAFPRLRTLALAIGVVGFLGVVAAALYYLRFPPVYERKWLAHIPRGLLVVTIPCLAWTGVAWYLLAREPRAWSVRAYARTLFDRRTALACAGAVIVIAMQTAWVAKIGTQGPGPTQTQFQTELFLVALRGPAWSLVHHVVYFGPLVLVTIAAWPRIAALAATWGPGLVLVLALAVGFAIGPESRHVIHLVPLLATLTIFATEAWWTRRRVLVFAALVLAWSKLWWKIGYVTSVSPFEWPDQRYFMHFGPWASVETYIWHLVAVVITAGVLALMLLRSRRDPNRMDPDGADRVLARDERE